MTPSLEGVAQYNGDGGLTQNVSLNWDGGLIGKC
jgi:hypothetical protein